jgi:hypothetical protein
MKIPMLLRPASKNMKVDNVFPWGERWPPPNDAGNYFGEECKTPAALAAQEVAGQQVQLMVAFSALGSAS